MIILAFLLAGVAVWNFIVGMWIVGWSCLLLAIWCTVEAFLHDPYDYYY